MKSKSNKVTARLLMIIGVMVSLFAYGQQKNHRTPVVGDTFKDWTFNNLTYYKKKSATINDFKGKLLVLDFWGVRCTSCVRSFSKLDALQKKWSNDMQIILVGSDAAIDNERTKGLYERLATRYKFTMPSAYDSALFSLFEVTGVPHMIVLDSTLTIRAIANSAELTDENISRMITGDFSTVQQKRGEHGASKPFTMDTVNLSDFYFQSTFKEWTPGDFDYRNINIESINNGKFYTTSMDLASLYKLAFIGKASWTIADSLYRKWWPKVIFPSTDSLLFAGITPKRFSYELKLPSGKSSKLHYQQAMQSDLSKYFNYEVHIEKQVFKTHALVRRKKLDLRTRGGSSMIRIDHHGLEIRNLPVFRLLTAIANQQYQLGPWIDQTGIKENIDVKLDAILSDQRDLLKALNDHGLDIKIIDKVWEVIVLKQRSGA